MGYLRPSSPAQRFDAEASDYFSPRPAGPSRSSAASSSGATPSWHGHGHGQRSRTTSVDNVDELSKLMEDVRSMTRGSASRWRRVATTMPRSLWKPESDSTSCDHLFLGSGSCQKEFGAFLAGYRLPSGASPAKSSESGGGGTTSALWGSIKINRRNHCWRCGNCFCNEHSKEFATLILDSEDAPAPTPPQADEEPDYATAAAAQEPTSLAPAPVVRSASACLSQYLASEAAKASNNAGRTGPAPTSSAVGSIDSAGSAGSSNLSGSSNLAESLRHHGVARTGTTSPEMSSHDGAFPSASLHHSMDDMDRPPSVSLSLPRKQNVAAALAAAMAGPSSRFSSSSSSSSTTTDAVSSRMTILADGRYVVRERVCARCSNIVDQAKARALVKQARREAAMTASYADDNYAAQQQQPYGPRRCSDPAANRSTEDEDYQLSLQRLYEDYRRERRKMAAAARSNSADAVPQVMRGFKLAPPPPRRYRRQASHRSMDGDESSDEEEDEEGDNAASRLHHHHQRHHHYASPHYGGAGESGLRTPGGGHVNVCAYFPVFPTRADFEDQHQVFSPAAPLPPRVALPQCGMGGQRLQIALARYG